jgi:hypothetical protein
MQDAIPRRAAYADLIAAPSNMVAEIIDGQLVTMPHAYGSALTKKAALESLANLLYDWVKQMERRWRSHD